MSRAGEQRRPRILVVEDDPMVLELIATRLDLAGFQTFYARNGREGLNRLQEIRPDGLVLDINMPVMDGFAVLSQLKAYGGYCPPTLILTARNKPEDVKTAIALGARDFLAKPFRDDQLIARVGRLVRRPSSSSSSGAISVSKVVQTPTVQAREDAETTETPRHAGSLTLEI